MTANNVNPQNGSVRGPTGGDSTDGRDGVCDGGGEGDSDGEGEGRGGGGGSVGGTRNHRPRAGFPLTG